MRTKPFEVTMSLDADDYGLSDDVVSVQYDGSAIVTKFGIDDEDVEYRCEPYDPAELERIAANVARAPEAYARWVLEPYARAEA